MDKITVKVPDAEFSRVLNLYASRSKRSFMESLNSRLCDILIKSYIKTRRAEKSRIEAKMNVVGYKLSRSRKTGALRKSRAILAKNAEGLTNAALLYIRRKVKSGHKSDLRGMTTADKNRKGERLLRAILRSVGFMASGFIPALKVFSALRESRGNSRGRVNFKDQVGQPKGFGTPAVSVENPVAIAGNTTKVADPVVAPAVEEAMRESMAYMEGVLRKNHEDALRGLEGRTYGK